MGVVDDAINKEEQVRAILEESSARLRAKIEARRASKLAKASEPVVSVESEAEVLGEPVYTEGALEKTFISFNHTLLGMGLFGVWKKAKTYEEKMQAIRDLAKKLDETYPEAKDGPYKGLKNFHLEMMNSALKSITEEETGQPLAFSVPVIPPAFAPAEASKKQDNSIPNPISDPATVPPAVPVETVPVVAPAEAPREPEPPVVPPIPTEPETEVVIPEVVEDSPKAKRIRKKAPKKSEAGIESGKEPLVPELEPGDGKPNANEAENRSAEEKIIDVDFREIDPNAKQVSPMPEYSESDKKIVELGQKLEDARKFYVEQDREMDKGASIWKKITGVFKRLDSGTLKEAFENSKLGYEDALRSYKNAILETEVQDKEDARIVAEWIVKGEFLNLENEKMNSRVKEEKGWPEKITNGYLGMVDKYRKLSAAKKIALGVGISTVGFGIGLTGGTLLAGGLLTSRQIFSMSVSSVGFKGMFDGMAQRSKEKKGSSEAKDIAGEVTQKTDTGKELVDTGALRGKLDEKIDAINGRMQQEKKNQRYRNWLAVGSGVALSYVARYFGKEAVEHSGAKEAMKNTGQKVADMIGNQKSVMGVAYHLENPVEAVKGDAVISDEGLKVLREQAAEKNIMPADNLAETKPEELVNLKVEKGSSLEGAIIQHLKEQGMDPDEAGKKAHLMALEFLGSQEATEHHLIQPDTKVVLDDSGEHIIQVGDDKALDFEKLVERQEGYLKVDESVSRDIPGAESAVAPAVETGDFLDEKAGELLENANTDLSQWQAVPERSANVEQYATLGANFTKSLAKLIGGNHFEDWAAVRGLPVKEVASGDSESGKRISALLSRLAKVKLPEANEETMEQFKKMIKPKGEERVYDWMKRVALLVKHSGIKKI